MAGGAIAGRKAGMVQGLVLLFPVTLSVMGVLMLAPVVPQLMKQFANVPGAAFWVPTLLTTPGLCIALFSPVAGYIGDQFGRRRLLIAATVIYAVVGVAPIFLNNLFAILATRVCVGICESMVLTLSTTLIGDFFHGHERDKWLASQTAVASTSAILFLLVGGVLGDLYGWRGPFAVYGVTLLLALGILLFTWEPAPSPENESRPDAGWANFPFRPMLGICAITILASVMFYTVQIQMSSALAALGVSNPARIGLLTAIASLAVPVGTFAFWLLARQAVALLLVLEFSILGIAFVGMSHDAGVVGFVAGAALNQLGAGMILPTLLTWTIRQLPFEIRGRGTGIWQSVFSLGQFISGVVVPAIAMHAGGLLPAFQYLGFGAIAAACLALAALVKSPARRSRYVI